MMINIIIMYYEKKQNNLHVLIATATSITKLCIVFVMYLLSVVVYRQVHHNQVYKNAVFLIEFSNEGQIQNDPLSKKLECQTAETGSHYIFAPRIFLEPALAKFSFHASLQQVLVLLLLVLAWSVGVSCYTNSFIFFHEQF